MKTILAVFILFCLSANAQKKDSTNDTLIVLSVQQANQLIQDIHIQASGKADIKNEEWDNDLKMIYNGVRIIPKADKPKTTK